MGSSNWRPVRLSVTVNVSRWVAADGDSLLISDPGLVGFITGPLEAQACSRRGRLLSRMYTKFVQVRNRFRYSRPKSNIHLHTAPYGAPISLYISELFSFGASLSERRRESLSSGAHMASAVTRCRYSNVRASFRRMSQPPSRFPSA